MYKLYEGPNKSERKVLGEQPLEALHTMPKKWMLLSLTTYGLKCFQCFTKETHALALAF